MEFEEIKKLVDEIDEIANGIDKNTGEIEPKMMSYAAYAKIKGKKLYFKSFVNMLLSAIGIEGKADRARYLMRRAKLEAIEVKITLIKLEKKLKILTINFDKKAKNFSKKVKVSQKTIETKGYELAKKEEMFQSILETLEKPEISGAEK